MKKYRSPEAAIRAILSGKSLNEEAEAGTAIHHIDPPYDLPAAMNILMNNGIIATKKDEKTLEVSAKDALLAIQVLDNAMHHNMLKAKPLIVSAEQTEVDAGPVTNPVKEEVTAADLCSVGDHSLCTDCDEKQRLKAENKIKKIDEEPEQIDEISQETLKNYIDKAQKDKRPAKADPGDPKQFKNALHNLKRNAGIRQAESKLKEDVEQIDEISKGKLTQYIKAASSDGIGRAFMSSRAAHKKNDLDRAEYHAKKADRREKGIHKAVDRLAKESVINKVISKVRQLREVDSSEVPFDQIDELSNDTLKSYKTKAKIDKSVAQAGHSAHHSVLTKHPGSTFDKQQKDRHEKTIVKRSKGLRSADSRLKEDITIGSTKNKEIILHDPMNDEIKHLKSVSSSGKKKIEKKLEKDLHSEESQIDEKLSSDATASDYIQDFVHSDNPKFDGKTKKERIKMALGAFYSKNEEVELIEAKKEDVVKAGKKFASHPRADAMYQDMVSATRHFNYVQDACDHVYNNNVKHVKYADWHEMKPHIEDHFRKHGLED